MAATITPSLRPLARGVGPPSRPTRRRRVVETITFHSPPDDNRVYLGNLHPEATGDEVLDLVTPRCGLVHSIVMSPGSTSTSTPARDSTPHSSGDAMARGGGSGRTAGGSEVGEGACKASESKHHDRIARRSRKRGCGKAKYCLVLFYSRCSADLAMRRLEGKQINGWPVTVSRSKATFATKPLPFSKALEVANFFMGFNQWSSVISSIDRVALTPVDKPLAGRARSRKPLTYRTWTVRYLAKVLVHVYCAKPATAMQTPHGPVFGAAAPTAFSAGPSFGGGQPLGGVAGAVGDGRPADDDGCLTVTGEAEGDATDERELCTAMKLAQKRAVSAALLDALLQLSLTVTDGGPALGGWTVASKPNPYADILNGLVDGMLWVPTVEEGAFADSQTGSDRGGLGLDCDVDLMSDD